MGVAVTSAVIVREGVEVTRGDGVLVDEGGREADEVDVPVDVCVLVCDDVTLDVGVLVGEDVRLPVDVVVADCVLERVVLPVEEGVRVLVAVLVLVEVEERVEVGVVVGDCVLVPVDEPEPVELAVPLGERVEVGDEVGVSVVLPVALGERDEGVVDGEPVELPVDEAVDVMLCVIDPVTVPDVVLVPLCDWAHCRIHAMMTRRRQVDAVGVALGAICNPVGTVNRQRYIIKNPCLLCRCVVSVLHTPCNTNNSRTGARCLREQTAPEKLESNVVTNGKGAIEKLCSACSDKVNEEVWFIAA